MRVTIAQINTTNGDCEGNVARILSAIEQAKKDRSDLIVFPEVTIQGYTSLDWFLDPDVVRSALDPLDRVIDATEGLTAIVGTVRPSELLAAVLQVDAERARQLPLRKIHTLFHPDEQLSGASMARV